MLFCFFSQPHRRPSSKASSPQRQRCCVSLALKRTTLELCVFVLLSVPSLHSAGAVSHLGHAGAHCSRLTRPSRLCFASSCFLVLHVLTHVFTWSGNPLPHSAGRTSITLKKTPPPELGCSGSLSSRRHPSRVRSLRGLDHGCDRALRVQLRFPGRGPAEAQ